MKTPINQQGLDDDDRATLAVACFAAEQAASLLAMRGFCRFAEARDTNQRPVSPSDRNACVFSIEGALARVCQATGRPFSVEAWVHRAYRQLFGDTMFVDNDRHSQTSAEAALRTCAVLLRKWSAAAPFISRKLSNDKGM
jgi:hypothetical protein